MSISVDELIEHSFFDDWNDKYLPKLEIVAQNCDVETFQPEDTLTFTTRSNRKPCFYLIRKGAFIIYFPTKLAVKIDFKREFAEHRFLFGFRSKHHETIGEIELTQTLPPIRARCMYEPGELIAVPVREFNDFLKDFPEFWRKLFRIQMKKLDSARNYMEAVQTQSANTGACVAASLLAIASDLEEDENQNKVEIIMLLKDFQAYISEGTRGTVIAKLNTLRDTDNSIKYIENGKFGRGVLAIEIDKEKLGAIARQEIKPKVKKNPPKSSTK